MRARMSSKEGEDEVGAIILNDIELAKARALIIGIGARGRCGRAPEEWRHCM